MEPCSFVSGALHHGSPKASATRNLGRVDQSQAAARWQPNAEMLRADSEAEWRSNDGMEARAFQSPVPAIAPRSMDAREPRGRSVSLVKPAPRRNLGGDGGSGQSSDLGYASRKIRSRPPRSRLLYSRPESSVDSLRLGQEQMERSLGCASARPR